MRTPIGRRSSRGVSFVPSTLASETTNSCCRCETSSIVGSRRRKNRNAGFVQSCPPSSATLPEIRCMSKHNRTGRSKGNGHFGMVRSDMWRSPAVHSLSANAKVIWVELIIRYKKVNNGEISLSCREAARVCSCSPNTAARAIDELIDRKLVRVTVDSNFNYKSRQARRYELTHLERNGQPPSNDWRQYKGDESLNNSVTRDTDSVTRDTVTTQKGSK